MSTDGYYGDFESAQHEQEAYEVELQQQEANREPDVVPCFVCGCQMYQEWPTAEGNICDEHKKQV